MEPETKHVRFNPYLSGYFDDPYPYYKELRDNDPIHKSFMGSWVVTRYKDCVDILKNPDFTSDLRKWSGFEMRYKNKKLVAELLTKNVLNTSAPVHYDLRNYLKKSFMPLSIEKLSSSIQRTVDETITQLKTIPSFDLISSYALPVPLKTICYIFDIPLDKMYQVKDWSTDVSNLIEPLPDMTTLNGANNGIIEFSEYLKSRLQEKEQESGDDFLSAILNEPLKKLIDLDSYLLPNLIMLFAAGHETTVNLIGNGIYALLQNPEQLNYLQNNPEQIETAIEELLRYDSSQQLAWRVATKEIRVGDHTFFPGEQLLLMLGSANRDPEEFSNPEKLDLSRTPNRHLSFGRGGHQCMGAWLARLQGRIAIESFVKAFPAMNYDPEQTEWLHKLSFRGLKQLQIINQDI